MQFITRYAEISDEVKLPYVETGDAASGAPVIFLHGVTDSWRSFELLLPHLPDSVRAFAVTQRGHGEASRPENYDPDDFAADIKGLMDAVGLEKAVIAGHSMGSFMAQRFAINYPERVSGLVLIGSFPSCRNNRDVCEFYETVIKELSDPIPEALAREFQESTFARPIPAAFLETVIEESLKAPARVWKAAFGGLVKTDNTERLGEITAPTLIVWGDGDAYFGRGDQETLLEGIPNSRLLIYEGVGHTPHWEMPEKTAADLADFILGTAGGKRAEARELSLAG